jgi:dipeptidyl aminopeptidase/acylaminoacyl peptidase
VRRPALLLSLALLAAMASCSSPDAGRPADDRSGVAASPAARAEGPAPVTTAGARSRVRVAVRATTLTVTILLPDGYRPDAVQPVLLALPPGSQGRAEVDGLLDRYWAEGARRGWVVVSPEAPSSGLFISGESARLLPDLLAAVTRWYPPEGGTVHVAGVSNGGLSAFRLALDHPELVRSLVAAPGYPPEDADQGRVATLAHLPVLLVVGGEDAGWREAMERTRSDLRAGGGDVQLIVSPGEGHIMQNVAATTLWDFLDRSRR